MQVKCWDERAGSTRAAGVLVDYAVRFAGALEIVSACQNSRAIMNRRWGGVLASVGQVAALAAT